MPQAPNFPPRIPVFLGFYMVSNGTRDLKQAETTTYKFAMPKGGKSGKELDPATFLPVPQKKQRTKKAKHQETKKTTKKTRLHTPRGVGQMQLLVLVFFLVFFLVFIKRKETAKVRL